MAKRRTRKTSARLGPSEAEYHGRLARDSAREIEALIEAHPDERLRAWYAELTGPEKSALLRGLVARAVFGSQWERARLDMFPRALRDDADGQRIAALARNIVGPRIAAELGPEVAIEQLWRALESGVTPGKSAQIENLTAYLRTIVSREGRIHRAGFGDSETLGAEDREPLGTDRRAAQRLAKGAASPRLDRVHGVAGLPDAAEKSPEALVAGAQERDLFLPRLRAAGLTKREQDLALALAIEGAPSIAEAARELGMAESTARVLAMRIRRKIAAAT